MNPMTDLAFLLVTFFMLTTTFKQEDPVPIDLPVSEAEMKLPEKDILIVSVSQKGAVLLQWSDQHARRNWVQHVSQQLGVSLNATQVRHFALTGAFGMPAQQLPQFLEAVPAARKGWNHSGIPHDSSRNELAVWLRAARSLEPRLRFAIKADRATLYPAIRRVMDVMLDLGINRFNLVTGQEKQAWARPPRRYPLKATT